MKNFALYGLILMLLTPAGCRNREKEARTALENARLLYENSEWVSAKLEIDSLRARYPQEVGVLREALDLMRRVELKEAERNIAYCDSLLPVRMEEARPAAAGFILEKDTVYGESGTYVRKRQTVERNVERSYLRCGVTEYGEMYLASVYFGARPIDHTGITVSTADGLYAETVAIPYDGGLNYRFKDGGNTSEIVTYKGTNGLDAILFVCTHASKRIKVDYTGGKPYTLYLSEADKEDLVATYSLAGILNEIRGLTAEREKAVKKKAYLEEKLAPSL
ncbi:MAG: hypothetical protein LBP25_03670 [Tannerellaceae bacterium]|jgi:hypothetical protein|nr:hypothetical protein [Tannerellaceae bacterium]